VNIANALSKKQIFKRTDIRIFIDMNENGGKRTFESLHESNQQFWVFVSRDKKCNLHLREK